MSRFVQVVEVVVAECSSGAYGGGDGFDDKLEERMLESSNTCSPISSPSHREVADYNHTRFPTTPDDEQMHSYTNEQMGLTNCNAKSLGERTLRPAGLKVVWLELLIISSTFRSS